MVVGCGSYPMMQSGWSGDRWGSPSYDVLGPSVDWQMSMIENITFPLPPDAGGSNNILKRHTFRLVETFLAASASKALNTRSVGWEASHEDSCLLPLTSLCSVNLLVSFSLLWSPFACQWIKVILFVQYLDSLQAWFVEELNFHLSRKSSICHEHIVCFSSVGFMNFLVSLAISQGLMSNCFNLWVLLKHWFGTRFETTFYYLSSCKQ